MRIRTIIADTMEEAMTELRETMGEDAIIISTHESSRGRGVEIRAAIEELPAASRSDQSVRPALPIDDELETRLRKELLGELRQAMAIESNANKAIEKTPNPAPQQAPQTDEQGWVKTGLTGLVKGANTERTPRPSEDRTVSPSHNDKATDQIPWKQEDLQHAFDFHRLPPSLTRDLIKASMAIDAEDAATALGAALDARFFIDPVPASPRRPVILVGGAGVGKTVTAAKLAAKSVLAGKQVMLVTTDTLRSGAINQIESFAELLKIRAHTADSPEALSSVLSSVSADTAVFIDTPATNPFSKSELSDLQKFIAVTNMEPIWVTPASGDAEDMADMADIFASIGAKRMITTRVDVARRLGGLISAADKANLSFAQISITPYLANGLHNINPRAMARLLLNVPARKPQKSNVNNQSTEQSSQVDNRKVMP